MKKKLFLQDNYQIKCYRDKLNKESIDPCPNENGFRIFDVCFYFFSSGKRKITFNSFKEICREKKLTVLDDSPNNNAKIFDFIYFMEKFIFKNSNKFKFVHFPYSDSKEFKIPTILSKIKPNNLFNSEFLTPTLMPLDYWNSFFSYDLKSYNEYRYFLVNFYDNFSSFLVSYE